MWMERNEPKPMKIVEITVTNMWLSSRFYGDLKAIKWRFHGSRWSERQQLQRFERIRRWRICVPENWHDFHPFACWKHVLEDMMARVKFVHAMETKRQSSGVRWNHTSAEQVMLSYCEWSAGECNRNHTMVLNHFVVSIWWRIMNKYCGGSGRTINVDNNNNNENWNQSHDICNG